MTPADLDCVVDKVAHWLPAQGPLKEFIHHNTLHAYQSWDFFEATRRASRLLGSRSLLRLDEYRQRLRGGQIRQEVLRQVAEQRGEEIDTVLNFLPADQVPEPGIAWRGLRARWTQRYNLKLESYTHPILFRWAGQFLDQGVAIWRMPHVHLSLFEAVMQITRESWIAVEPFSHASLRRFADLDSHQVVLQILDILVADPNHYERYLLEMSLAHAGWSGMIRSIELHPENLVMRRKVSLVDFIALELMAELAYLKKQLGSKLKALVGPNEVLPPLPIDLDYRVKPSLEERVQEIWQVAYERSYSLDLLEKIQQQPLDREHPEPRVSAFFCIDDRECSLRRHLESLDPQLQTFGTAGYFAIDCAFQGAEDAFAFKHCPAGMEPKHLIREARPKGKVRTQASSHWVATESTLLRGFLISQTLGLWAALRLAISIFWPGFGRVTASNLSKVEEEAELEIQRDPEHDHEGPYWLGYSDSEMADRVEAVLQSTGALKKGLGQMVVLVGHGASSVNNPYFAAYDCGACSGKAGAPNARAFAMMANRQEVRQILEARGMVLGHSWFLGALHDTTRDEIHYYGVDELPKCLRPTFESFQRTLDQALANNAKERCQKFALVSKSIGAHQALREVKKRSEAIFETRPELNHANNAACIVGRRELTQGLMLDRRAFLNSYDPEVDPQGKILAQILSAVVPVCGGINLEYFFSRVDPRVYGAGSKLPHNVNGLIGVINGTQGDLLTGLPTQMTELHEPLRLLLLVQHRPEIALAAAQANSAIFSWIKNGWIRYFSIDPDNYQVFEFEDSGMRPLELQTCRC